MELSFLNQLLIVLINSTGICLAFWVFFVNRKSKVNQLFFLMTIFILSWITFYYLMSLPVLAPRALLLGRLGYAAVFLFFTAAYFFFSYFLAEEKKFPILNKIVLNLGIILALIAVFTDLITKSVEFREWGVNPVLGKGWFLFSVIIIFLTLFIITRLLIGYFKFPKAEKIKIQYFLIGVLLFAGINFIFNVIVPLFTGAYRYSLLGNYSAIFLLGFTAYAIVKRQLFGIRVVLVQLLVGLIAVLLLINFFISESTFEYIWKGILFVAFLFFGYSLIKSVLTEIKRREELENLTSQLQVVNIKLKAAYKKLEKLNKAKSEFISIASHQLRTPLTAIKGYISMLLEGDYGKLPAKAVKSMESVYQSSERLIKLVNDLLDISRIEAGKMEIKFEKAALEDMISSVVEELKIEAEKKGIYLKWEKPEEPLPEIFLDKEKIRQVFLNVIDNGIRYTEKGGVRMKLKIKNEKLKIEVSDTGEGLTEEEISKMFESFSRGMAGTRLFTEGAGLGLYVAKKYVELHQGRIWVESPGKGKGSTFYVELPIKGLV